MIKLAVTRISRNHKKKCYFNILFFQLARIFRTRYRVRTKNMYIDLGQQNLKNASDWNARICFNFV